MIEFVRAKPPVYDKIVAALGVPGDRTVYTYAGVVYSPSGEPSEDVMEHERVHVAQQTLWGTEEWWERYLRNPDFRLQQELAAYRVQYRWLKAHIKDRNELAREVFHIARTLAGPLYGRVMSFNDAHNAIKGQG